MGTRLPDASSTVPAAAMRSAASSRATSSSAVSSRALGPFFIFLPGWVLVMCLRRCPGSLKAAVHHGHPKGAEVMPDSFRWCIHTWLFSASALKTCLPQDPWGQVNFRDMVCLCGLGETKCGLTATVTLNAEKKQSRPLQSAAFGISPCLGPGLRRSP